jgi:hypothetical protein
VPAAELVRTQQCCCLQLAHAARVHVPQLAERECDVRQAPSIQLASTALLLCQAAQVCYEGSDALPGWLLQLLRAGWQQARQAAESLGDVQGVELLLEAQRLWWLCSRRRTSSICAAASGQRLSAAAAITTTAAAAAWQLECTHWLLAALLARRRRQRLLLLYRGCCGLLWLLLLLFWWRQCCPLLLVAGDNRLQLLPGPSCLQAHEWRGAQQGSPDIERRACWHAPESQHHPNPPTQRQTHSTPAAAP